MRRPRSLLTSLRHAHQIVQQLALAGRLGARHALELPQTLLDSDEIGPPLRFHVTDDVGEAKRQLAVLPPLALVDQDADTTEHVRVGARQRIGRCRRRRLGARQLLPKEWPDGTSRS